jgi:hypothetical protein
MSQLAEIQARLLPMESLTDKLCGDLSQSIRHVESANRGLQQQRQDRSELLTTSGAGWKSKARPIIEH